MSISIGGMLEAYTGVAHTHMQHAAYLLCDFDTVLTC